MRSVEKHLSQRRITRSFVPQIAGELSQTKGFLTTITRTKKRKIIEGFVTLQAVTQYFLHTIKKTFAKLVKEKDT